MRLTLRTLLAYLDDTLDPAAAHELGQKLAETPTAQELVGRIREATRRRRLTAPSLRSDDLDPNVVAEYLDSLLGADEVAELEKLCLESDTHLAEAAACHQILTMLGQPAPVTPAMRDRMYGLVHSLESQPRERAGVARPTVARPTAARPLASRAAVLPMPLPSMFVRRPMLARVLSGAAVLVGAVVLAVLIWRSLHPPEKQNRPANGLEWAAKEPDGNFLPPTDKGDATLTELPPLENIGTRPARGADDETEPKDAATKDRAASEPDDSMPANEKSEPPSEKSDTKPAGEGEKPSNAAAPADTAPTPEKPEGAAKPEPAEPPRTMLGRYASTSGVLLHYDRAGQDWRRSGLNSEFAADEALLSLPSFRSNLQWPTGAIVELVGETELIPAPADEGVDARVQLDRGRIVLRTAAAAAVFQIEFLDQVWKVRLKGPESAVGVALTAPWRPGRSTPHEAVILVPRGEVVIEAGRRNETLGGPVQLRWIEGADFEARASLAAAPSWMEREEMTPLQIKASEYVASESALPVGKSTTKPLVEAAGAKDIRRETRVLAVQCLGALGRLPQLIELMGTPDRPEVREEAIKALRGYMARGPAQEAALAQAINAKRRNTTYGALRAESMNALLGGFSDDEARKRDTYEALIALLHPDRDLAMRELAYLNLVELTGSPKPNLNYSADKPSDTVINAWRHALDEGRLPPRVRGKM